jgi:hypothetical protein
MHAKHANRRLLVVLLPDMLPEKCDLGFQLAIEVIPELSLRPPYPLEELEIEFMRLF